ncbi:MAG: hypothetical protein AMJ90_02350 [candidate division Zixibacteria bacterium SM23_73_2]|nr:MAG: hypothetical protein AMJ90_02350 [candidate division Zixibacteria bacterium SM23_73_2]
MEHLKIQTEKDILSPENLPEFKDKKVFGDRVYTIKTGFESLESCGVIRLFKDNKLISSQNIRFSSEEVNENLKGKLHHYHKAEASLLDSIFQMKERIANLDDGEADFKLGMVFLGMDLLDEAEEQFNQAISKSPEFSQPHNLLGLVFLKKGKNDSAIKAFQSALKINSLYADFLHNYGCAFLEKKMYREAISQLEKAVAINPRYQEAFLNLGFAYLEQTEISCDIFNSQNLILALNYFKKAYKYGPRKDKAIAYMFQRAITWEDLSRIYMILKDLLLYTDSFRIKSICEYFSLRFKYEPESLEKKEVEDYLLLVGKNLVEGKNYPDLRNSLTLAHLYYSRYFVLLSLKNFEQKEDEKNLSVVKDIGQNLELLLSSISA